MNKQCSDRLPPADHAFLWKPKLRIPDIYESRNNQMAFGRFLESCCDCDDEATIVRQIQQLDSQKIKGLGPAAANLLYTSGTVSSNNIAKAWCGLAKA